MTGGPDLRVSPLVRRWVATHSANSQIGGSQCHGTPATEPDEALVATISVGDRAYDVATCSAVDHVYVLTTDSVEVISPLHHIVSTLPVGPHPKAALPSSDGTHLYVTGYDGAMTIITTADNTAKSTVVEPSTAEAVSADGQCIFLAHNDFRDDGCDTWASVIGCDGTAVAQVPVEGYAADLALARDGSRLYIASSDRSSRYQDSRGSVWIVDTSRQKVIDVIGLPFAADTVTVSPDGSFLYVTHFDVDAISIIDGDTNQVDSIALNNAPIAVTVSPDSTFAYVTTSRATTVIDSETHEVKSLSIADSPHQIHVGHDGKHAYLPDFRKQQALMLDTMDNSVVATAKITAQSGMLALSADDDLLYVADYWDGTIEVISTALMKPYAWEDDYA